MKLTHAPLPKFSETQQQETPMLEKNGTLSDEVQWEINRMRHSLNVLTLKNFMFDVENEGEEDVTKMEVKNIPSNEEELKPSFKRSTSKHRHDTSRTQSGIINQDDVIKALTASQEKLSQSVKQTPKVKFAGEDEIDSHMKLTKDSSRESDEVATINSELPWQKKNRGYKTVTPYFKPKNKIKALSQENVVEPLKFRPIESSQSIEDINKEIFRPVPIFLSKSFQDLPTKFETFDQFVTKSSDDLLLDNIDGVRKVTHSKTHRLLRMRSTSSDKLDRPNDLVIYENLNYEAPLSADCVVLRNNKKKPIPQPRLSLDVNELKEQSAKTVTYVLDKAKDEFVLQSSDLEDAYENVLVDNNVDAYRDSDYFQYLLNSREDCKFLVSHAYNTRPLCSYKKNSGAFLHT